MSKYIIELDENAKEVVVISLEDGDMWTETMEVEDLEQLNSDYINEHYGDLQDTAYQRGLEDAWEAARKVIHLPEGVVLDLFTDCYSSVCTVLQVFLKYEGSEVIGKLKAYEKKPKDKIEVGDIVERYLNDKLDSTGLYLGEDGDYWNCLFWTGAVFGTFAYPKNQFKKTGRHVDIDKILEAMKHD